MSGARNVFQGTVYAETLLTAEEIAAHLARSLRGSVVGAGARTVEGEHLDLDVTTRDEWPPRDPVDAEDAFLYFPYQLEIFTSEGFTEEDVVADLSAALETLDQLGVRYVTAAEFEHELPRGGRSETSS